MTETCELRGSMHHVLNMQFVQSADLAALRTSYFFLSFFFNQKSLLQLDGDESREENRGGITLLGYLPQHLRFIQ